MPKPKGKPIPASAPVTVDPSAFEVSSENVTRTVLDAATTLHRIHLDLYGALQFSPGKGNARFSPIKDSQGNVIPTIYAGETFECAAMESVFHDVSYQPGLKAYDSLN